MNGSHLAQLQEALLDAFDFDGLTRLVRIELNGDLAAFVAIQGRTLADITFDFVLWALRKPDLGLKGLLAVALRANPGNPRLKELQQAWAGLTFTLPGCPYPGMRPFSVGEQERFYGRDTEIQQAVDALHHHPFLAIIGPSGSGKSSLIAAGVIPALQASSYFADRSFAIKMLRPGAKPLDTLAGVVESRQQRTPGDERLLLVVDQYEELYTLAEAGDQEPFVKALLDLMRQPDCYLILAVRADFYVNLMNSLAWPHVLGHRLEITPLRGEALREAIDRPARNVGVTLEPALVERLLADARDEPGVLPFIQETLVMLWDRSDGLSIGLETYTDLVGDKSGRPGLEIALARHADHVYLDVLTDDKQRRLARIILLRLVQFGEGRPDTRRQQTVNELCWGIEQHSDFDRVLDALTANRLLTLSDEAPYAGQPQKDLIASDLPTLSTHSPRVDLSHEALINGWPNLKDWLKDNKEGLRTHRKLTVATQEWKSHGRDSGILYRGVVLQQALEWSAKYEYDLNESEREFLATSKEHAEKEIRDKEAAETRKRIYAIALISLSAIVLIVIAISIVTNNVEKDATLQVQSELLAEVALGAIAVDPVSSIKYALSALANRPDEPLPIAEFALTQALRASLERKHVFLSEPSIGRDQIAAGTDWLVAGGKSLRLVPYDLDWSEIATLAKPNGSRTFESVKWAENEDKFLVVENPTGQPGRATSLSIWHKGTLSTRRDHSAGIACAEWKPDGKQIAFCEGHSLWIDSDGAVQEVYEFGSNAANAKWAPEENRLVAWDVGTDEIQQTLLIREGLSHRTPVTATIQVNSRIIDVDWVDPMRFATIETNGVVRLWSVAGEQLREFGSVLNAAQGFRLSPDRKQLLTFLRSGDLQLWDVESRELLASFVGHDKPVLTAEWAGDHVATGSADGTIRIWSVALCKDRGAREQVPCDALMTLRGHRPGAEASMAGRADVLGLRWLDGGKQLLSWGEDASLRIWQVLDDQGKPLCNQSDPRRLGTETSCYEFSHPLTMNGPTSRVFSARWTDTNTVAGIDSSKSAWLLPTGSQEELNELSLDCGGAAEPSSIVWDPGGMRVFVYGSCVGGEAAAEIWDPEKQERILEIPGAPIAGAFWLPEGVLVGTDAGDLRLIQVDTGAILSRFEGASSAITAVAVSDDGQLAIAEEAGPIHIWQLETGEELAVLNDDRLLTERDPVRYLRWTAGNGRLLSTSRIAVLWDVKDGDAIWEYGVPPDGRVSRFLAHTSISPNDSYVAIALGRVFAVLDLNTGEPVWENNDHLQPLGGVQWVTLQRRERKPVELLIDNLARLINGRPLRWNDRRDVLVTWSGDGTTRLWDWHHRAEITRLVGSGPIRAAELNSAGTYVLTLTQDGELRVWDVWPVDLQGLSNVADARITRSVENVD